MSTRTAGGVALVVGGGVVLAVRRLQRRAAEPPRSAGPRSRWRAVTVDRSPEEVMPDQQVPAPLAALGDLVEVEVRPAPGDNGSELRARLRVPEPTGMASAAGRAAGNDPRQRVRAALREAKQLIEVGEVLRVDPTPHGRRTSTPTGAVVERATDLARGEGLL